MKNFNFGTTTDEMFRYISNVEEIDLTNSVTVNLTVTTGMFSNCTNLKKIYVSNTWNLDSVNSSDGMFSNCSSLVGGQGTTYDSSYTDKTYARIDGGTSNPGYLTLKTN